MSKTLTSRTVLGKGLCAALLALLAWGCSTATTTTTLPPEDTLALCSDKKDNDNNGMTDCADSACAGSTDKTIIEYCAKHGDAQVGDVKKDADTGSDDADDSEVLTPGDGTATDGDVSDQPVCKVAGQFGCPCTTNGDCDSGYCIDNDQGKVCTQVCNENCPTDWKCIQGSGADATYICVPAYPTLCMPCSENKDCQTNGANDNYCVPFDRSEQDPTTGEWHYFVDGHFCMTACTTVTDATGTKTDKCKAGYSCKELKLFDNGKPVKQCVPDSNECGCHDSWAQEGKSTQCTRTSAAGQCVSKRQCQSDATGKAILTLCDAPAPVTEVCGDNIDNDCNGKTDEPGAGGCTEWYVDNDGDGYGTGVGTCLCNNPGGGYSNQGKDCQDYALSIHPNAVEICDNIDNNCNGVTDEAGSKGCTFFYHDKDGDGYGDPTDSACMCKSKQTSEWILQAADCDDTPGPGAKIHPGVDEVCDGVDNNCNDKTDEQGAQGCQLYYVDQDNDTFGVTTTGLCLCAATKSNSAGQPGDCDDGNGGVNPSAVEVCDGVDNDCNGKTDDGTADANCGAVAGGTSKCVGGACTVGTCDKGKYDVDGDPTNGCECVSVQNTGNLGGFCGNPIDLGVLPDGSATIQKAGQILPGESGDWYKFNATDVPDINGIPSGSCDQYDVRISFVLNPNNLFVFDVYRGSCGAGDQVCSAETQHDWSTSFYGPPPFGPQNKANPNTLGTTSKSPVPEAAGECNCIPANAVNPACVLNDNVATGCGPNGYPGMNICKDNSAWYYVRVFTKPGLPLTCDQYIIKFDNSSTGAPPPQN